MKITRLYTGSDGESHFEDLGEIHFEDKGQIGQLSQKFNATGMLIHQYDATFKVDWYNPPLGRICVIMLEGQQEIRVGDGTKRVFSYGDILFVEDTTGHGHCTRSLSASGKSIILTLD